MHTRLAAQYGEGEAQKKPTAWKAKCGTPDSAQDRRPLVVEQTPTRVPAVGALPDGVTSLSFGEVKGG
jgi:hypothetical protein